MATQAELLQTLTVLEKQSYIDVIDIAIKEYSEKKVLFTMLNTFMIKSLSRSDAILAGYSTKYKSADVTDSYIVFRNIQSNIGGQVEELDKQNGTLNMMIYGDTKKQRELKRYVAELQKRNVFLSDLILQDLDTAKEGLIALKGEIPV